MTLQLFAGRIFIKVRSDQAFQEAIENLYAVFAIYPAPKVLDASPLRDPVKILRDLTSTPLRILPLEKLQYYTSTAITTVGEVNDYKHFLPRIVELATVESLLEPEIIAHKLQYGLWRDWPVREQDGLRQAFVLATMRAEQQHPEEAPGFESWLRASAMLQLDVEPILQFTQRDKSLNAALQVSNILLTATLFEDRVEERGYWESVDEAILQLIRNWLLDESRVEELTAARKTVSPVDAWLLDKAIEQRQKLISQRQQ